MPLIRFWCRLLDREGLPSHFDGVSKITILDETQTPVERIHGRLPVIIDWYGEVENFPRYLKYLRDSESYTVENFITLQSLIDAHRLAIDSHTIERVEWKPRPNIGRY